MIKKILIPTSGTGSRLGSYTQYTNKSLLKIGDKYAICHIVDLYKHIENVEFVITLGYFGEHVKDFLQIAYPNIKFTFVNIDKYEGPGSSLGYSMSLAAPYLQEPFIFHCCDAILKEIPFNFPNDNDYNTMVVYTRPNAGDHYATINVTVPTSTITKINDKGETQYDYLYVGVSKIYNYRDFWSILNSLILESHKQSLSDIHVFEKLMDIKTLKYKVVNEWYDTGNIHELNITKQAFQSRYHVLEKMDESICFLNNTVIKFFYNRSITKSRYERGLLLKSHVPRVIEHRGCFFSMELIEGTVLSEYYKYGEILKLLEYTLKQFWKPIKLNRLQTIEFQNRCKEFYYTKTINRIKEYKKINREEEINIVNGINICSCEQLIEAIDFPSLTKGSIPSQFHGDFILDNIIKVHSTVEYGKQTYRFIDWRQDFGGDQAIGDLYYDLAKLRHNIIFNHSNIEQQLFTIESHKPNEIFVDLKTNYFLTNQLTDFDNFIISNKFDLNRIKLLTALIWINMAPLHTYPLSRFLFYFGKFNLTLVAH